MRYEIHHIRDAECTIVHAAILATTDDLDDAKRLAADHSGSIYGAAIVDTHTAEIDFVVPADFNPED